MNEETQVLVLGGGPAGSTVATLLAREGLSVTLLERERFPRYHIGESLLPGSLHVLDLMGAREKVELHGFHRKFGAYYAWGDEEWAFRFGDLTGQQAYTHSWQVVRSEFDELLLRHASDEGVDVQEAIAATDVAFEEGRARSVRWRTTDTEQTPREGTIKFDHLVDATGRFGLIANRTRRSRRYHESFKNVAIWSYWRDAAPLAGAPPGAIGVISVDDGWIWYIPLHDGTHSIGVVLRKAAVSERQRSLGSLDAVYDQAIAKSPIVSSHLGSAARTGSVQLEADYSYSMDRFSDENWYVCGDAACFLDPLLSTGVHLAMFSASTAAACIASTVRNEVPESEASEFYNASYLRAYLRFLVVVSSFYRAHSSGNSESYFWQAQQLSQHDYRDGDLRTAFIEIVSGMEDHHDSTEPIGERVAERVRELIVDVIRLRDRGQPLTELDAPEREEAAAKLDLLGGISADAGWSAHDNRPRHVGDYRPPAWLGPRLGAECGPRSRALRAATKIARERPQCPVYRPHDLVREHHVNERIPSRLSDTAASLAPRAWRV